MIPSVGSRFLFHAKVVAVVLNVHSELLERAFVEESFYSVARGHQAFGAARFKLGFAARVEGFFATLDKFVHQFFCYSHIVF